MEARTFGSYRRWRQLRSELGQFGRKRPFCQTLVPNSYGVRALTVQQIPQLIQIERAKLPLPIKKVPAISHRAPSGTEDYSVYFCPSRVKAARGRWHLKLYRLPMSLEKALRKDVAVSV